jgi:AraC-like DNA-binding protein
VGSSQHLDVETANSLPARLVPHSRGAGKVEEPRPDVSPASSTPSTQRYVFDACRQRPARAVRARMETVRRSIDTGYFLEVDCRTLAQTAGMSVHHFIRMFRDMFGLSPHQYVTHVRVAAAKRLLLSSVEPIDVIAVGVGFRSGPSLSRAFKRIEGSSVSRYCQTLKKGPLYAASRTSIQGVVAGVSDLLVE